MGGQKRDGHHEAKRTKDSERIEGSKTGQGTQRLGGSDLLDWRPKLTHSPDDACSCIKEIKDIAGGAVSSALPPHPSTFPVQPYLSRCPPYQRESIFVVVPLALSPSVPPGLGPVDLLIAFRAPFRIPPSPFLCHACSPPLLALNGIGQ